MDPNQPAMPFEPSAPAVGAHEVMGGDETQQADEQGREALKAYQRYVKLGTSNYSRKLKKLVEKGDGLMKGTHVKVDDAGGESSRAVTSKVNKLRRKIVSGVTQIYARNPKFVGIPKRPILVPEDPVMDPMTGQMIPPIDPMTGQPMMKDISEQVAEVTAAIMDQIFMESNFKAEAKACTVEAHHRPGTVMQVGYQFDEDNKVDDVYFRWRSFKRVIIDPCAEIYHGTIRKCRFIGVKWSLRKDEAEGLGLDWSAMVDREEIGTPNEDDDEQRDVWQVWCQPMGTYAWISDGAARFARDPEPWPWEIDGYPFAVMKLTEDTDEQFSKPLIVEAEGIQEEIDEMRETMNRVIVGRRPVVLYDSDIIDEKSVEDLAGRRPYGWKGVSGLAGMKTPIEVVNEETLDKDFYEHYDRNEAEMDSVLGTSANEQMAFTGKTAREVEEVSKNAGTMTSGKADVLADFLNQIVRKALQIMRQTYDEERATQITTRDGARYWVKWKGSEILSEVDLRVEVGSTQSEDDETKKQVALNLFDKLGAVPGINVRRLANDLLREFGKKDPNQYWEQVQPQMGMDPAAAPMPGVGGSGPGPVDVQGSLAAQMSPAVQGG